MPLIGKSIATTKQKRPGFDSILLKQELMDKLIDELKRD